MKRLLILTALIPFAALAQPLNTMNNPNQQGYVIPSQQRMQTEMMSQQQQQKGMLNQQLRTQTQMQQQSLQNQMNANTQRAAELLRWGVDSICTDAIDLIGPDFSSAD